jgi:hypothetical protein
MRAGYMKGIVRDTKVTGPSSQWQWESRCLPVHGLCADYLLVRSLHSSGFWCIQEDQCRCPTYGRTLGTLLWQLSIP